METAFSRRFFFDPEWSQGFDEIAELIKRLHARGVMVLLQPCVTKGEMAQHLNENYAAKTYRRLADLAK